MNKVNRKTLKKMIKNNEDISNIDVSEIKNMSEIFYDYHFFNQDISGWDVSKVENMHYMFEECLEFNQDISTWDVSNIKYNNEGFARYIGFKRK